MSVSEEIGFPWKYLFPIKQRPHYDIEVPNDVSPDLLPFLPVLIAVPSLVAGFTFLFYSIRPKSTIMDRIAFYFLCLSCIIHFSIELWWARYNDHVQNGDSFFAKLWREFGKCDTRWWSEDEVIFSLEFMAGYFCGPMALITIIGYLLDKPWRYITQTICVTSEMYGLLITWIPAYFTGLIHIPTWSFSLYYGYFWLLKSPWLIMPCLLSIHSCMMINKYYEGYLENINNNKKKKKEIKKKKSKIG